MTLSQQSLCQSHKIKPQKVVSQLPLKAWHYQMPRTAHVKWAVHKSGSRGRNVALVGDCLQPQQNNAHLALFQEVFTSASLRTQDRLKKRKTQGITLGTQSLFVIVDLGTFAIILACKKNKIYLQPYPCVQELLQVELHIWLEIKIILLTYVLHEAKHTFWNGWNLI